MAYTDFSATQPLLSYPGNTPESEKPVPGPCGPAPGQGYGSVASTAVDPYVGGFPYQQIPPPMAGPMASAYGVHTPSTAHGQQQLYTEKRVPCDPAPDQFQAAADGRGGHAADSAGGPGQRVRILDGVIAPVQSQPQRWMGPLPNPAWEPPNPPQYPHYPFHQNPAPPPNPVRHTPPPDPDVHRALNRTPPPEPIPDPDVHRGLNRTPPPAQMPPVPTQPPVYAPPVYAFPNATPVIIHSMPSAADDSHTYTKYECSGDCYRNQLCISAMFLVCGVLCLNMFFVPCAVAACINSMKTAEANKRERTEEAKRYYSRARRCNIATLILSVVGIILFNVTLITVITVLREDGILNYGAST